MRKIICSVLFFYALASHAEGTTFGNPYYRPPQNLYYGNQRIVLPPPTVERPQYRAVIDTPSFYYRPPTQNLITSTRNVLNRSKNPVRIVTGSRLNNPGARNVSRHTPLFFRGMR